MKIAVIGHSMVALRQQMFFQELAKQGHDVLVVGPGEWGNLRATNVEIGYHDLNYPNDAERFVFYTYLPCRHFGEDIYKFRFLNVKEFIEEFSPDWLYVQQEPGSRLANEVLSWNVKKRAIFTWENIILKNDAIDVLPWYDLVVCGNPAAVDLVGPYSNQTKLLLQVGVNTDHFQARPGVGRTVNVGYIGRATAEKGLPYLKEAWPAFSWAPWTPFEGLPWRYSDIKVLVAFSQDIPYWHEQAPNYVVLEALSCGCNVVISDTPAMKSWLEGTPGVYICPGHKQIGTPLDLIRIHKLKETIQEALDNFEDGAGRQTIIDRFSCPVVARDLVEAFNGA